MRKLLSIYWFFAVVCLHGIEADHFPFKKVEEMSMHDDEARLQWVRAKDPAAKKEIANRIRFYHTNNRNVCNF
jgi:hypothetical protein